MNKVLLSVAALALAGSVMAQDSRVSVGLEVALPMGDFGDAVGIGFGGTLGFELPVTDNIGLIAQAGYINFSGKDIEVLPGLTFESPSQGAIPIQVGGKYYFTDNQEGAYLGLLTGVHMVSSTTSITVGTTTVEESNTDTNFGFAPLLGFIVGENIDIAVRYQIIMAKGVDEVTFEEENVMNSYIGLRAAYMF